MSPSTDSPPATTLAHLLRSLAQLISDMWDYSLRLGVGPRASVSDEEASKPLLAGKGGAPVLYSTAMPTGSTMVATAADQQFSPDPSPHPLLKPLAEPSNPSPKQSAVTPHSPTRLEKTRPDVILAPVNALLAKLKSTTPASLPPYNPRMRTKTHAQVLKGRLLPIGDFIVTAVLVREPEESRGALELELCRHIATHYWPLPVPDFAHLYILEMYRNARFNVAIS